MKKSFISFIDVSDTTATPPPVNITIENVFNTDPSFSSPFATFSFLSGDYTIYCSNPNSIPAMVNYNELANISINYPYKNELTSSQYSYTLTGCSPPPDCDVYQNTYTLSYRDCYIAIYDSLLNLITSYTFPFYGDGDGFEVYSFLVPNNTALIQIGFDVIQTSTNIIDECNGASCCPDPCP